MNDFLKNFPGLLIATLDDKASKGAEPKREPLKELVSDQKRKRWALAELQRLNSLGAGIFFAYNRMGDTRNKASVLGINAWAMEIDDIPKEEQYKKILMSPLDPSAIVETRNSYHCYWFADGGTVANAERINMGLIQYFGSDPALKDTSRLLRIPGFYHNKKAPFMVEIKHADYEAKYTDQQMLEAFPYTPPTVKAQVYKPRDTDNFWQAANAINAMAALERLSGDGLVNGERFTFKPRSGGGHYILVNDEPCDAWVDSDGRIGSGKGGGPSVVNWLKYYGNDFEDIADWLNDKCSDMLPISCKKTAYKPSITIKQKQKMETEFVPYTWGTQHLDSSIWALKKHEVVCLAGVASSGKTAYAFFLAKENAKLGHKVCYVVLEMSAQEILERAAADAAEYTIEEDRLEKFPAHKKKIFDDKLAELKGIEGLTMLDMGGVSVEEVLGGVLAAGDFDMVFIDNFDRIGKTKGIENAYETDNHKITTLLTFTKEHQIPICLVHHINSKKPQRDGGYGLSDLRGSGKITDECNTVFFLSRDTREDATVEDKEKFFIQAKKHRRKGQLVSTCINFKEGDFYDISRPWESAEHWQNKQ